MISDSCHSGRVAKFPLVVTPPTIIGDNALEWMAAMCSHVPNKGEQMVRYYKHLGLWEVNPPYFWRVKPRPPPTDTLHLPAPRLWQAGGHGHEWIDYSTSQLPVLARLWRVGSDQWGRATRSI